MNPVSQPFGECPCGSPTCSEVGTKLAKKTGHLVGCTCASCRNAKNHRSGHKAQQTIHEALGGKGQAPTNEASAHAYVTEIALMPESKAGEQIPVSFLRFISSRWFHHALKQAHRAVPIGSNVLPAVAIDERWILIDTARRGPFLPQEDDDAER